MNVQAKPNLSAAQRLLPFEGVALVLQGGGALGAYQAEVLAESNIHPDWIAGISIGGINAAIIAGNSPNVRVDRLREFWTQVTSDAPRHWFGWAVAKGDGGRNLLNQFSVVCWTPDLRPNSARLRFQSRENREVRLPSRAPVGSYVWSYRSRRNFPS